KRRE
ncbi:hypothetical protein D037_4729B, partial [Vibrio parahaemolyticus IDH02640]